MFRRFLEGPLREAATHFPVVTVTGSRQSGKTTLVRAVFKEYDYVTLELPDERALALSDPRGFLAQFPGPVILDEVQRAPDLFSYIQVLVDEEKKPGRFIMTGSQNFLLLEKIAQSLAGRCAILHLLPLSLPELLKRKTTLAPGGLGLMDPPRVTPPSLTLEEALFTGFYPAIHDQGIPPTKWLAPYYQTYVERDVRSVLNIGDLETFGRFVRVCASRTGQLANLSGMATDCGITHTTAKRWLSVLEASFILALVRPHHKNFGKRLIKSPKLYFLDTGLLCYLLGLRSPDDIRYHAMRGAIFETYVFSELYKSFVHRGEEPRLAFWRDVSGHEVDFLLDDKIPVEVKSGHTLADDAFDGLDTWCDIAGKPGARAAMIYGGDRAFSRHNVVVYPWFAL